MRPLSGHQQATALAAVPGYIAHRGQPDAGCAQITQFSGGAATSRLLAEAAQNGGYACASLRRLDHAP